MKKILIIAAALMITAGAYAQSEIIPGSGRSYTFENTIVVNGKAEKNVVPDEIYINIIIDETALKQKQSVEKMETDMIRSLKSLGIDTDKNLKIGNMSSAYKDYFLKKNTARTSASYELKVDGVVLLGKVYQSLESLGISNMSITKLSHSKIKEFQNELRIEAMKNAQEIATVLAEAIDQKAGKAVQITDYNNDLYVPAPSARNEMFLMKSADMAGGQYETELDFKEIKLTYSISVKFALQ